MRKHPAFTSNVDPAKKNCPHPAEEERLNLLYDLEILDTGDDDTEFNMLTELARKVFKMPVALVSLIDNDRQWLKSHPGLDILELEKSVAFCQYTILPDALDVTIVLD